MTFDFQFTATQVGAMLPGNAYINDWYNVLVEVLPDYNITSVKRVAAFMSQCAHESSDFTVLQENLNYTAARLVEVWPRIFPTQEFAAKYAGNPEMIANLVYADRLGNGDESSGDGWNYRGRGLIQITGRINYQQFADSISSAISDMPAYMLTFQGAIQSACWFWESHDLNDLADQEDVNGITVKINGGTNGAEDRLAKYQQFTEILNQ